MDKKRLYDAWIEYRAYWRARSKSREDTQWVLKRDFGFTYSTIYGYVKKNQSVFDSTKVMFEAFVESIDQGIYDLKK